MTPKFSRVLLKLSGEAFSGNNDFGIDLEIVKRYAREIKEVRDLGVDIAIVVGGGKMGTMVELSLANTNALTDPSVKTLARNLAMQVAAAYPKYVCRDEVPVNILEEEKRIYRAQAESEGKPLQVLDKIALGKLGKFYQTVCLLEQSYIKEMERSVNDVVKETADKLMTAIEVKRFARFALGEKE